MMKTKYNNRFYILVPTLSKVSPDRTIYITPEFVDLKIEFVYNLCAKNTILKKYN